MKPFPVFGAGCRRISGYRSLRFMTHFSNKNELIIIEDTECKLSCLRSEKAFQGVSLCEQIAHIWMSVCICAPSCIYHTHFIFNSLFVIQAVSLIYF